MFDFRKSKNYLNMLDNEQRCLMTESMKKNQQILEKIITSDRGVPVVLLGPKECGKHTLLAILLKKEELSEQKAVNIDSSEIIRNGQVDIKLLNKICRSTITVQIKEQQKIIEGEVVSITSNKLHLKTMDMESSFEVGVRMNKEFEKARVCVGDVVKIYKESCFVTRVGRASTHNVSFRCDLLPIVPLPEGECIKTENTSSYLTLNELDIINSKEHGEEGIYTNKLVNEYIQSEVDKKVNKWIKERKATLHRGFLIIENCEHWSREEASRIEQALNLPFAPNIVFLYNQKESAVLNNTVQLKLPGLSESELAEVVKRITDVADNNTEEFLLALAKEKGLNRMLKVVKASQKPVNVVALKKIVELFEL